MSQKQEFRTLEMPVEVRTNEDENKNYIVGYALKFNSESENLGGFVEKIDPRALESADISDVRALFNHSADKVLGRTKSGTLKLEVDEIGLRYTIEPPNTTFANDLMESMSRGDINQSSFGFVIDYDNEGDNWNYDESRDVYLRTINKFRKITDVSVVTYPAYQATESVVAKRSLDEFKSKVHNELKRKQIDIELELI
ncbi:HK97 family phage prohead protease [Priestia koreensis]|uniref:HK97 family phage prohead protease n=1 Tax=Priestia koreensis TaxID=284581 RepID=UPI003D0896CF